MSRYARQLSLPGFGAEAQARLAQARVLIVGAGALGVPTALYLVGAGVGQLTLVDGDRIAETNLHRQLLYTPADLGRLKVEVMAERLRAQNPDVRIDTVAEPLTPTNADALIAAHALACDGTDTFAARYLLNDRCVRLGLPLVSGSVYQWQGQLAVLNAPPGHGPNLRDLYPSPPPDAPSCETGGVIGALPGALGALMALEAIKLITGLGEPLGGRLLLLDGLSFATRVLQFSPTAENPLRDPAWAPPASAYDPACYAPNASAAPDTDALTAPTLAALLAQGGVRLLDVRSAAERAEASLGGLHIPLGDLPRVLAEGELDDDMNADARPWVAYCASGVRSRSALALLRQAGYLNARHLAGGLSGWQAAALPLPEPQPR